MSSADENTSPSDFYASLFIESNATINESTENCVNISRNNNPKSRLEFNPITEPWCADDFIRKNMSINELQGIFYENLFYLKIDNYAYKIILYGDS
ncbi:hypothetical protein AYI70_g7978 [Smittium culicis]|uniref:Uncharacterized protein n=1 Tax=Smittium culicis TaxID=133412 RepID=A0A1R1X7F4_9FUNG|nr:hypothetical protein AYI70_g10265 [Smittium culicis]OMJ14292.1 hypothetical protein AYI70_g7978 [Smittium culicis]